MVEQRFEENFFLDLEKFACEIKHSDSIVVIHHYDADGITSGAIAIKALEREGKKVTHLCLKQLYKENIDEIKKLGKTYLFVDFGSGQLDHLINGLGKKNLFILDHHQPDSVRAIRSCGEPDSVRAIWSCGEPDSVTQGKKNQSIENKESENDFLITLGTKIPRHINPLFYGIDGGKELSGSGTAFFFALALNKKNVDLSGLAIVGAVGDMQDFSGKLIGLNRKIIDIAVKEKILFVKNDLRLYGRISRPLVSFLMFSSSPIIPGLTASEENCVAFLKQNNIPLKDSFNDEWLSYEDLSIEQKQVLSSALIIHLSEQGVPEWKIQSLIGEVYTLEKELLKSPLRDAKEFATACNSAGRHAMPEVALQVCLGNRSSNSYYGKLLLLIEEHKRELRKGIEFVNANGVEEKKSFYFFDAKDAIQDSLVGIIAGMLYGSVINEDKPIIALARNEDNTIKVSGRGTQALIRKGLNLGKAFKQIEKEIIGVQGGGHCLHPDTLVQKKRGEICKISEIIKTDYLLSNSNFNLINSKCDKVFVSKKKKTISFKTKNTEIISSEEHRFFKFENFSLVEVKAKDLLEKDFVLGVKKIPFAGQDIKLINNKFIYLKKESSNFLKNKRLKLKLSKKELTNKLLSFENNLCSINALEQFRSHKIIESHLIEYLSLLKISKKYFYSQFIEKKFVCNSNKLNFEIAWLLGYIQSDGNIGKKRIEAKESDRKILEKFQKSILNNFSLKSTLIDMGNYKKIRIYSADLCRFFEKNFPELKLLTGNLNVPKKIMISKNNILASYISGLFDAEACVFDRFIMIRLVDEYLLKTVQILLLRFGVKSNFREVKTKKTNKFNSKRSFVLDITDFDSIKIFQKKIGFTQNGKKDILLKKIIKKQSKKKRNSMLFSPITYGFMRKFIKQNNISRELFDYNVLYSRIKTKRMNYHSLNKYFIYPILKNKYKIPIDCLNKIKWLDKIVNSQHLTFYEIKSKKSLGYKNGFLDLSIPKTKNFMANGLIVHNSIAAGMKIPSERLDEFLELLNKILEEQLSEK